MTWFHYRRLRRIFPSARLDEQSLRSLIGSLRNRRDWPAVVKLLEEYANRFPRGATRARLMQAGILTKELQRPKAALRAMEQICVEKLSSERQRSSQSARNLAERQIADGVLEIQGLTFAD